MSMHIESVFIKSEPQDECLDSLNVFSNDSLQNTTEIVNNNIKTEENTEIKNINLNNEVIDNSIPNVLFKNEPEDPSNSYKTDLEKSLMFVDENIFKQEKLSKIDDVSECSVYGIKEETLDIKEENILEEVSKSSTGANDQQNCSTAATTTGYLCKFCNKIEIGKKYESHLLKQHKHLIENNLDKYISSKIYKCDICAFQTLYEAHLNEHFKKKHKNSRNQSVRDCKFCQKTFMMRQSLEDHLLKHHSKLITNNLNDYIKSPIYKCQNCDFLTITAFKLEGHYRTVHNKDNSKTCCQFCKKKFLNILSLEDHLLKFHNDDIKNNYQEYITYKILKCEICDFMSTVKFSFTTHVGKVHNVNCNFCEKLFVSKYAMDNHVTKQHKEKLNDKSFKDITSTGHSCVLCPFKCKRIYALDHHVRQCHTYPKMSFKCSFCTHTFVRKFSLDSHLLSQHYKMVINNLRAFVSSKTHACDMCDFVTVYKQNLTNHIKNYCTRRQ